MESSKSVKRKMRWILWWKSKEETKSKKGEFYGSCSESKQNWHRFLKRRIKKGFIPETILRLFFPSASIWFTYNVIVLTALIWPFKTQFNFNLIQLQLCNFIPYLRRWDGFFPTWERNIGKFPKQIVNSPMKTKIMNRNI